jgi:dipeptidyl aminopeptidase/acylaminoacyl peptidase
MTTGSFSTAHLTGLTTALAGRYRLVRDLRRGVAQKLPPGLAFTFHATWSPDGARLALDGFRDESRRGAVRVTRADGSGGDEYLPLPPGPPESGYVVDWTPDGRALLLAAAVDSGVARRGPWLMDLATRASRPWLAVPGSIYRARLAPDGRWLAYESDETGASEIYLRPFPGPGAATRVSPSGGMAPTWRGDARELYYLTPDGDLMAVDVAAGGSPATGAPAVTPPQALMRRLVVIGDAHSWHTPYVPFPDGQRFLVLDTRRGEPPLTLVAPWTAALRSPVP